MTKVHDFLLNKLTLGWLQLQSCLNNPNCKCVRCSSRVHENLTHQDIQQRMKNLHLDSIPIELIPSTAGMLKVHYTTAIKL